MKKILTTLRPGFFAGVFFWVCMLLIMKFCSPEPSVKNSEPVQEVLKDSTTDTLTNGTDITFGSGDIEWTISDLGPSSYEITNGSEWVTPKRKCKPRPVLVDTCRLIFVGTQGIKVTRIGDSVIIGFETIDPPDHVTPIELLEMQLFDSLYRVDSLKIN